MEMIIAAKRLRPGARLPRYGSEGAAGLDLEACLERPLELAAGATTLIPTGLAMAIPEGYVGLIRDRSGLALAGLQTVAGVIDSDYRGEVMVALHNASGRPKLLDPGDRIAQMLVLPCPRTVLEEMADLPATRRGSGGFGSTGR